MHIDPRVRTYNEYVITFNEKPVNYKILDFDGDLLFRGANNVIGRAFNNNPPSTICFKYTTVFSTADSGLTPAPPKYIFLDYINKQFIETTEKQFEKLTEGPTLTVGYDKLRKMNINDTYTFYD